MTSRRKFLIAGCVAGVTAGLKPSSVLAVPVPSGNGWKHWVWTNPDKKEKETDLRNRYKKYYKAGIRGIFFEADSELHFRAAKAEGLEAHRWMWTMNRGEKSLLESHPEWYAVNRKGESCADKPPYVDYYRWLCPSKPEVKQYLTDDVKSILSKDYVDGIHLDYVRFCDVILPVNLWDNYHIEQTRELPEYDYCYCDACRDKFRSWRGISIDDVRYPEASLSWREFRYHAVTDIVNEISKVASSFRKPLTAAVFPTPEVARRNVRQDWTNWKLNGVCPMIYHGFYRENVAWIGDAVAEGVNWLNGKFPLYAGLFIPDFKGWEEMQKGIELALSRGARGVSLFGDINDDVLACLAKASANVRA